VAAAAIRKLTGKAALVPPALVAVKVTLNVPLAEGVPVIWPLAGLSVSPAGRAPEAKANDVGLFVAVVV
jgi:hypothetical protein